MSLDREKQRRPYSHVDGPSPTDSHHSRPLGGSVLADQSSRMSVLSAGAPPVHPFFDRPYPTSLSLPPLKQSFSDGTRHIAAPAERALSSAPGPYPLDSASRKRKVDDRDERSAIKPFLPPLLSLSQLRYGRDALSAPPLPHTAGPIAMLQSQTLPELSSHRDQIFSSETISPTSSFTRRPLLITRPAHSAEDIISPPRRSNASVDHVNGNSPPQTFGGPRSGSDRYGLANKGQVEDRRLPPPSLSPSLEDFTDFDQSPTLRRASSPVLGPDSVYSGSTSSYQMMTLQTSDGPVQVPVAVDVQAASRVADEKRRRNAGASARFRERRKKKEVEASTTIRKLEQQVKDLADEVDYYRNERNHFRHAARQQPGGERNLPRPDSSPRLRRAEMPLEAPSPPDEADEYTHDPRERIVRRRTVDGQHNHVARTASTSSTPAQVPSATPTTNMDLPARPHDGFSNRGGPPPAPAKQHYQADGCGPQHAFDAYRLPPLSALQPPAAPEESGRASGGGGGGGTRHWQGSVARR